MVAVPELPEDPALYAAALADAGYFEAVHLTAEDLERTRQYQANLQRNISRPPRPISRGISRASTWSCDGAASTGLAISGSCS